MKAFRYVRPSDLAGAAKHGASADAAMKAGGIDLLDRMKERVHKPDRVVALLSLRDADLRAIEKDGNTLRIGAFATLADLAASDADAADAARSRFTKSTSGFRAAASKVATRTPACPSSNEYIVRPTKIPW